MKVSEEINKVVLKVDENESNRINKENLMKKFNNKLNKITRDLIMNEINLYAKIKVSKYVIKLFIYILSFFLFHFIYSLFIKFRMQL